MELIQQWKAFDGKVFDSEAACAKHEAEFAHVKLVGLTAEQIERAMKIFDLAPEERPVADAVLANALEDVGVVLQRARLAKREIKRERRGKAAETPPLAPIGAQHEILAMVYASGYTRLELETALKGFGGDFANAADIQRAYNILLTQVHASPASPRGHSSLSAHSDAQISLSPEDRREPRGESYGTLEAEDAA